MRRGLVLLAAAFLCGCGRYAGFTLPAPAGTPSEMNWQWVPEAAPVLEPGPAGTWDSSDVLNPSVIRWKGGYLNLYSGFDGRAWHTGDAGSPDGVHWTKRGRVLSPDGSGWESGYIAANGSAIAAGGRIRYYYQAGGHGGQDGPPPQIGLAESSDGATFTKHAKPVLTTGPYMSWDERGVSDPYVILAGGRFYLFYTGLDRARRQRLGVAESSDGVAWTKLLSNPVLDPGGFGEFDENGLGEPAVWASHGYYWMLYTGRDRAEHRRIGLARSRDGVHWTKLPLVISGAQPWDSMVVCDPTVEPASAGVRVWFGGGDVARPDERIHGRIGVGLLRPAP